MNPVPFSEAHQLNQELELDKSIAPTVLRRVYPAQLAHGADAVSTALPGQARVELRAPDLDEYLHEEFLVPQLDKLAPKLWLVRPNLQPKQRATAISNLTCFLQVSTPRSSHISALHHQAVRGRDIILAENLHLHLVWNYDKIFIKPIPKYLLSSAFWQYLAVQPVGTGDVQKAAIGFMRSYSHLIQHESDFNLAQDKGLIPKADGNVAITWEAFAKLITAFDRYQDIHVSPRYSYGELRLTRLNFYTHIFLGKLTYHHIDAQWSTYLNRCIAPLLIVFAISSTILNAMQVELSVQGLRGLNEA
jgi:hypothetical protein